MEAFFKLLATKECKNNKEHCRVFIEPLSLCDVANKILGCLRHNLVSAVFGWCISVGNSINQNAQLTKCSTTLTNNSYLFGVLDLK